MAIVDDKLDALADELILCMGRGYHKSESWDDTNPHWRSLEDIDGFWAHVEQFCCAYITPVAPELDSIKHGDSELAREFWRLVRIRLHQRIKEKESEKQRSSKPTG